MARITLEAQHKPVTNRNTNEVVYDGAEVRIKIFDDENSDGMTLDAFESVVEQKQNWIMINSHFKIGSRSVPTRYAYYADDVIKIKDDQRERVYDLPDSHIQAFVIVAKQTRINMRELELRRQDKKAA